MRPIVLLVLLLTLTLDLRAEPVDLDAVVSEYAELDSVSLERKLLEREKKSTSPKAFLEFLSEIGAKMLNNGNYERGIQVYRRALKVAEQLNDLRWQAEIISNIGVCYDYMGDYARVLKYTFRSLKLAEEINDSNQISKAYNNIGIAYDNLREDKEALKYYQRSYAYDSKLGNLQSLAGCMHNMGSLLARMGSQDSGLAFIQKALEVNKQLGNRTWQALNLSTIAAIYQSKEDYPKAIEYGKEALRISQELGDPYGSVISAVNIADVYFQLRRFNDSEEFYLRSLAWCNENQLHDFRKETLFRLSELYGATGDLKSSLSYYRRFVALKDSLFNADNTKSIHQASLRYEFEKKEALAKAEQDKKDALALEELRREKFIRNSAIGGAVVLLLFAVVFYRQRNKTKAARQRSDELLLNILPSEVAEELKVKGEAEARFFDDVTVLFTDFKGFTSLSEAMSPKELIRDLHECFSAFDAIAHTFNIEKIKTIGDAYMAVGGLPSPDPEHARQVVLAALEMAEFIEQGKQQKIEQGWPYFDIRIGVHTGPVVAGIVGVKKFQYDIWGDTVNTASRMESHGEVGKVNISQATYDLIKDDPQFAFEHRGKVEAKGKGEVDMYFVRLYRSAH